MSVITDVNAMQNGTKWKPASNDIAKAAVFWLAAPVILSSLLAWIYGLAATTFNWVGQDLFWTWFGCLTGWNWLGAWIR
jgi:hypothetical protein